MLNAEFVVAALVLLHWNGGNSDELKRADSVIAADQLAVGEWPIELPADVRDIFRRYALFAGDHGLSAYVVVQPRLVFFSKAPADDANHMLSLVLATQEEFSSRFRGQSTRQALSVFHLVEPRGGGAAYAGLIDLLAANHPYLQSWAPSARNLLGFSVYQPMVIGFLENENASKELNRDNNLVHFAAMTSLYDTFGVQPYWVRKGMALDLEASLLDRLFALTYQPGSALSRPAAWKKELQRAARRFDADHLQAVLSLDEQAFDSRAWVQALALMRFLTIHKPSAAASILRSFAADRAVHLRDDPFYIPTPDRQREILNLHLEDGWVEEMQNILGQ